MNCIVVGALNTDLIVRGVAQFPEPGEYAYGDELVIAPGGKSRNIASMMSLIMPENSVAVVGRTTRDAYGLWKVPIDALQETGVSTKYVRVLNDGKSRLPGVMIIPVDKNGDNKIYALPGSTRDFTTDDIDASVALFDEVAAEGGMLVCTLEAPVATAIYAIKQAVARNMKVLVDPGGVEPGADITELLGSGVYVIKPNVQETRILTGIDVIDAATATAAANILMRHGAKNVLITVGADGAYLFTADGTVHIPAPEAKMGDGQDETGCGDQAMAVLCAALQSGKGMEDAARDAVYAGTMQFYRHGIQPLTKSELHKIIG